MQEIILKRIKEIDDEIDKLTLQRKKLVEKLGVEKIRKDNKLLEKSLCYTLFGKKFKDLSKEQKKDYQRIVYKKHYDKKKEQK